MSILRIVIIEDEPVTARNLVQALHSIDQTIDIKNVLPSIEDAVKWFSESADYDLIFSDIKLADGLSFDIFKQIELTKPVIFVTAYDDYAIRAFKSNGIDYILKPFEPDEVEQSLAKFKRLSAMPTHSFADDLSQFLAKFKPERAYKRSFLVHFRDKLIPVGAAHISFFYSANEIVHAYLNDGRQYAIEFTLDNLIQQLDEVQFFKANRQFIINRAAVQEVNFYFNGRLSLKLKPETPERVLVSKARVPEFKAWMSR